MVKTHFDLIGEAYLQFCMLYSVQQICLSAPKKGIPQNALRYQFAIPFAY